VGDDACATWALAHLKDSKTASETALALRVTPRAVTQWPKWFIDEGLDRVAGIRHYWSPQRLPKTQEEPFRRAVEQLQDRGGGGHVRGDDIRQLLDEQFGVAYTPSRYTQVRSADFARCRRN
jgi:hypothetical protein